MTDTPKTTLAEELHDKALTYKFLSNQTAVLRQAKGPQVSAELVAMASAATECANLADQHEARWAAERAKLVEELEAFRALARNVRDAIATQPSLNWSSIERAVAKLAPKESAT